MEHLLALLGFQVRDSVTQRTRVVVSISFDISGCIQGYVMPQADKDGKVSDGWWCDTKRLTATAETPVVARPTFEVIPGGTALPAPASKPAP